MLISDWDIKWKLKTIEPKLLKAETEGDTTGFRRYIDQMKTLRGYSKRIILEFSDLKRYGIESNL